MNLSKKDYTDEERKLAVILVLFHDKDVKTIANIFRVQPKTVREWIKKFGDEVISETDTKDKKIKELEDQLRQHEVKISNLELKIEAYSSKDNDEYLSH